MNLTRILIPISNMSTELGHLFCPVAAALLTGMFLFEISIGRCETIYMTVKSLVRGDFYAGSA